MTAATIADEGQKSNKDISKSLCLQAKLSVDGELSLLRPQFALMNQICGFGNEFLLSRPISSWRLNG
jgi:hypothetical protein